MVSSPSTRLLPWVGRTVLFAISRVVAQDSPARPKFRHGNTATGRPGDGFVLRTHLSLFKGLAVKSRRALSELARRLRADRAPETPLTFILAWFGAKVSSAAQTRSCMDEADPAAAKLRCSSLLPESACPSSN